MTKTSVKAAKTAWKRISANILGDESSILFVLLKLLLLKDEMQSICSL
jgi:hypothetical protein